MHNEKVFTPDWVTNIMLDELGYTSSRYILGKHIIDNSSGDGAILAYVVYRYVDAFFEVCDDEKQLVRELETYIHGIELDEELVQKTKQRLTDAANKILNLPDINWDIRCADTLEVCEEYYGKMDYVIGNPPYCNVHHLEDKYNLVKKFSFAEGGMTDLYLVFYEIGLKMCKPDGRMTYISPDSWMRSIAGKPLREYIANYPKILQSIISFGYEKVFKDADTYVAIITFYLDNKHNLVQYKTCEDKVVTYQNTFQFDDILIGGKFYLSTKKSVLWTVKKVKEGKYDKIVSVKNGFATLKDKLFLIKNMELQVSEFVLDCYKASRGEQERIIYPYFLGGTKSVDWYILPSEIQEFLLRRKYELRKKYKFDGMWWEYGRCQGLADMGRYDRYAVSNIIREGKDLRIHYLRPNEGVYSGLYIVGRKFKYPELEKMLYKDERFMDYIKVVGQVKSGGYYSFSSKDLEQYINYKLATEK